MPRCHLRCVALHVQMVRAFDTKGTRNLNIQEFCKLHEVRLARDWPECCQGMLLRLHQRQALAAYVSLLLLSRPCPRSFFRA